MIITTDLQCSDKRKEEKQGSSKYTVAPSHKLFSLDRVKEECIVLYGKQPKSNTKNCLKDNK